MEKKKLFRDQKLSKKQMMNACGGANPSNSCYPGELMYTCTLYYEGMPQGTPGKVCATSPAEAAMKANSTLMSELAEYQYICQ